MGRKVLETGDLSERQIVKLRGREPFGQDYALRRRRRRREETELGWDAKGEQRSGVKLLCCWQEEMSLIVDHPRYQGDVCGTEVRHLWDVVAVAGGMAGEDGW
jgi:hypothetical protein